MKTNNTLSPVQITRKIKYLTNKRTKCFERLAEAEAKQNLNPCLINESNVAIIKADIANINITITMLEEQLREIQEMYQNQPQ